LAIAKATLQHRNIRTVHGYVDDADLEDEYEDEDDGEIELATGPVRLDRVKGSKFVRVHTIPEIDKLLGGGWVRGFVYLLAGDPGAGKSTLTLQIASALNVNGKPGKVYYASAEEREERIRERSKRLGLSIKHMVIWHEIEVEAHFDTEELETADFVIYDSLQELTDPNVRSNTAKTIINEIKKEAEELGHVALVISQLTKDGRTAGPNSIEHRCDATIDLFKAGEDTPERVIQVRKNRGGPTDGAVLYGTMTAGGIVIGSSAKSNRGRDRHGSSEETETQNKTQGRRAKATNQPPHGKAGAKVPKVGKVAQSVAQKRRKGAKSAQAHQAHHPQHQAPQAQINATSPLKRSNYRSTQKASHQATKHETARNKAPYERARRIDGVRK